MGYVVFFAATGLTARFVWSFLYLFFNRKTLNPLLVHQSRHRVSSNERAKRRRTRDVKEIITTGDILANVSADLKDGFVETKLADGAMLNNEGWKTY